MKEEIPTFSPFSYTESVPMNRQLFFAGTHKQRALSKVEEEEKEEKEQGSSDSEAEASDSGEDVCLVCGLSSDSHKILRCANCAGGGMGQGVFHYDCLKPPLTERPPDDDKVKGRLHFPSFLVTVA